MTSKQKQKAIKSIDNLDISTNKFLTAVKNKKYVESFIRCTGLSEEEGKHRLKTIVKYSRAILKDLPKMRKKILDRKITRKRKTA